ncbi:hemagglutinin repeat-containing protein [Pseudomonas piscis]|uniref:Hemagglutinin repeat-containing protein n=1 Tax=Pseudomonas piscis TaxID=2614538 RepID=A0ABY9NHE8_9PSED|nr:hemagglutinin repeat-containing protein [Pseudomonas piscis]WMN17979.1 hemagglutinin repeat-containing protein [Pseudomonas piscis]
MDVRQFAFLARQPSAALQSRDSFWGLPKRGLAFILANMMFWQPLVVMADGIVVNGSGTTLGQAGNGVPVVNIATPNGGGLSHNKFSDYNVGQQGVILNNATDRTQSTQLGGIILGNPNLGGRAANVILNEVNGGSPSQLKGYTEVAGQSAHVIVANPYGVTCNGCGFINTPKTTLTTGKPVIENGQLQRYQVDQGSVAIEGAGLNASNIDQFEIITRSAKVNAQIQARHLALVTGANDVDAQTLKATVRAANPADAPQLAIDSSALGGMYAGAIKLVGTEAGVGVKLDGKLIASGGDIQLDANGQLRMAQVTADKGAVAIKAQVLETQGAVYAGTELKVETQGDLHNRNNLVARDRITLTSGGTLNNQGIIEAGVNADNSRNAQGDLSLRAQSLNNAGKSLVASRDLSVTTTQALDNQGGTLSGQRQVTVKAGTLDNRHQGRVLSAGNADLTAGQLLNTQGGLVNSAGQLNAQASALDNRQGELSSLAGLKLQVATLDNVAGLVTAGTQLHLNVDGALNNQGGQLTSLQTLDLKAGQVDNRDAGRIASNNKLTASLTALDQRNGGRLTSTTALDLDLNQGFLNNQGGLIRGPRLVLNNLAQVSNQDGEISSAQAFTLNAQGLDNRGGELLSDQGLTLRLDQALNNAGGLISAKGLTVRAAALDNSSGTLTSQNALNLNLDGALTNHEGELSSGADGELHAASLDNHAGKLISEARLTAIIAGLLDNQGQGQVSAQGALAIQAGSFDNRQGHLIGQDLLTLDSALLDNRHGKVSAGQRLQLNVGHLDNRLNGLLLGRSAVNYLGTTLDNRGGLLSGAGPVQLDAALVENAGGRVASQQDLNANVERFNQQKGELVAQGNLSLAGRVLDNREGGLVGATKALELKVDDIDNQSGSLSGSTGVKVNGARLDNSGGKLLTDTDLTLQVAQLINQSQGLVSGKGQVTVQGQRLDNREGTVSGEKGLALHLSGKLDNTRGVLTTEGALGASAASVDNSTGKFSSAGALTLASSGALDNRQGSISSAGGLGLGSSSLDNRHGLLDAKGPATVTTGAFDNTAGGRLVSLDSLELKAGQVSNGADSRIASDGALTASVSGFDQQGGQLFSKTSLSLDLNNGQLNNRQGLINGPLLMLKNLNGVDNRNGEISSSQAFVLAANTLDNSAGKLISQQALTLRIEQALANLKGQVSAAALQVRSASLDNRDGMLSSRGATTVAVDGALLNQGGSLIGDGLTRLDAASLDNTHGQVSSKSDVLARVGQASNHNGLLLADGSLTLEGAGLDNRNDGLVRATQGVELKVAEIDNRGGEISSKANVHLKGRQLDNSDGGQVVAGQALDLTLSSILNRQQGKLQAQTALALSGTSLDNTGGSLSSQEDVALELAGDLLNDQGSLSSEGRLTVNTANLHNNQGVLSSAGQLGITSLGLVDNRGGQLVSDAGLVLHSASLDNTRQGTLSSARALRITTGTFDNSQGGHVSARNTLDIQAGQLINRDGGQLTSNQALSATVTGLDQQGGKLSSNSAVTLDLNHGQLNNQGGLINGPLLNLKNLKGVNNQGGEISSAQGFVLAAEHLDNGAGKLLSNQALTLRVSRELNNLKGLIAAQSIDGRAASLDNSGGTLTSRSDLLLNIDGQLGNRQQGLINATRTLTLGSTGLDNQQGTLTAAAIGLDLGAGDLNNNSGLISSTGVLTLEHLRDLDNRQGEISTTQQLELAGRRLDNDAGTLISHQGLSLNAGQMSNRGGLMSGWQGVKIDAANLDNRNNGTVSSRYGKLEAHVANDLLNRDGGALVSQQGLSVSAANLDNSERGVLSSAGGQRLSVSGRLDNSQGGLIDSGADLDLQAQTLVNAAGTINAQQQLNVTGTHLDNSAGTLASNGAVTLDLLGALVNTRGKLASAEQLLLKRASQVDNQGGELISQGLLSLAAGSLDNRNRGTVAANGALLLNIDAALQNSTDGLLHSRNADVKLKAGSLDNVAGVIQGQTALDLDVQGAFDNRRGKVIAETADLSLAAATIDNRGGTLSSLKGALQGKALGGWLRNDFEQDNPRQGGIIQAQALSLSSASLNNHGGRLAAQSGDTTITTGDFDNRDGGVYAQQAVKVNAASFDNSGDVRGQVAGNRIDFDLSGALNNQRGILESAQTLNIRAASLDNRGGQLRALGAEGRTGLQIAGAFDSRAGKLETANRDLTLDVGSFQNQGGSVLHAGTGTFDISTDNLTRAGGNLVTRGGLTLDTDTWTNSSVIQAGRLTLNVNTLNQTAEGQLLASESLVGRGGNWSNDGLIASDGSLDLTLAGSYGGSGRTSSQGSLDLSAAQLNLASAGSLAGGGRTSIDVLGQMSNLGRVTSSSDLHIKADTVLNQGTLAGAQGLTVKARSLSNGSLETNGGGLLFSGADMDLQVTELTNNRSDIYSLGNLLVAGRDSARAARMENISGTLESQGNMQLDVQELINRKEKIDYNKEFVSGNITVSNYYSGSKHRQTNYYARETFRNVIKEDSPQSLLHAGGNLTVRGGDITNTNSTLSATGNISIDADNLLNKGDVAGESVRTRMWYSGWAKKKSDYAFSGGYVASYNAQTTPTPISEQAFNNYTSAWGGGLVSDVTTDSQVVGGAISPAIIQAGGAISIKASQTLVNSSVTESKRPDRTSQPGVDTSVRGGVEPVVVKLNAQLPPDLAQQQVNPLTLPGFSLPSGQNGLFRLSQQDGSTATGAAPQQWSMGSAQVSNVQHQKAVPTGVEREVAITGSTQLQAQALESLQANRQKGERATGATAITVATPGIETGPLGRTTVADSQPTATLSNQASDPGLLNINRVQGLPERSPAAQPHKYLIETNPVLTDLKQFMSSDYLLSNLGYNPDDSAKRLGDGFYEQKLIQQAVTARTGQRFINGQDTDEKLFKYLMDNAIKSKQQLNLAVGVSLTSEQVAALTHDIVWLESTEVNGEQVLVPVLYLAHSNNRLAPNGALIAGSDLNLIAGKNLDNAGTLRATHNLSAQAGQDLVNSGLIEAGDRLDLLAGNTLVNKAGGIIAGRDVSLRASQGDVINERTVTGLDSGIGDHRFHNDLLDSSARIEAANQLSVDAGRDLLNNGGSLKSGADLSLKAGRDIRIASVEKIDSADQGAHHRSQTIAQSGSTVEAGRDLKAQAGRDLTAIASQIEAKRDINMTATENLTLASAADEEHAYSKTKKVTKQEDHVQQVSTTLAAGGNVTLKAGEDLQLIASRVTAGNEAYLYAVGDVNLDAAQNSDYSYFSKTKKSSSSKKFRLDETESIANVGSLVSAGTNSVLVAGKNLQLQGSTVIAEKGNAKLAAGKDVQILAVTDSESDRHERKQSKSGWGGLKSSKVEDKVSEVRTTSVGSMVSGDTVSVTSGRDTTVTGSSLVSTGDLSVLAVRDLTIDAAANTFSRTEMHKQKNRDLTGILTANKLGVDDITGNQHLSISSRKHNGTAQETTLAGSTIGSSAGNVNLNAGRELKVVASDLVSTKDMSLSGADVTIAAGIETARQTSTDSARSLAVGRVVGGALVDTARSIRDATKAAKEADDSRLKAVKLAQATLAAYNFGGQASDANGQSTGFRDKQGGSPSNGSLIKIGTELASVHSKSSSEYNSQTAKQSTLKVGQELSITASGAVAGSRGDIQVVGSSLESGNTLLLAKNDVLLQSAQDTSDRKNSGSSSKTAIGASFNIGEQNGFTLDLGAQGAKNKGNGSSVTQVNTTLKTKELVLQSGRDTALAGAQVQADVIKAKIGGDLNIQSRQDTESSNSKQSSGGVGASICIPPFCYGSMVTGSANIAAGKTKSDYKAVTDQSGFFAGTGGYDIHVGKNTTLDGAVIASEASADRNHLSTDRLLVSDIKNTSEIQSQSAGIGISSSSVGGSSLGGSIPVALAEKDRSHTRSAVSDGTIVIRSPEGDKDLVGLNRDTNNANQHLDRPDEKKIRERIDLIQSSAQLASGVISAVAKAKSDEAKKLEQQAKEQAKAGSPGAEATARAADASYAEAQRWQVGGDKKLMADIASGLIAAGLGGATGGTAVGIVANTSSSDIFNRIGTFADAQKNREGIDSATKAAWEEGGAARVLLHALAGAAIGLSSGNAQSGALGAGTSAALIPSLIQALADSGMKEADQKAIASLVAAGVGSAIGAGGGSTGSIVAGGTALGVEKYNRQLHPDEIKFASEDERVKRYAKERGITDEQARMELLRTAAAMVDRGWSNVLGVGEGNRPEAVRFLRTELSQSKSTDLFQVSLADYNNERLGLSRLMKDRKSVESLVKYIELVDPYTYLHDPKNQAEILSAKGQGSAEGFANAVEGAASFASKTTLWLMSTANCPSCGGRQFAAALEAVQNLPEEYRLKGYLDTLHIMQGYGADVLRQNEASATSAGVGIGLGGLGAGSAGVATTRLTGELAEVVGRRFTGILNEASEQALIKSGGIFGPDGKPVMDLGILTREQKGVMGDLFGERSVQKIVPDGQKLARVPGVGETGIDDLYKVNRSDVDFVVIEYKFIGDNKKSGASGLGSTQDGKQGSMAWTLGGDRLERAVGKNQMLDVEAAMRMNRTETWVVRTRPDGSTEIEVLDARGKVKAVDTSKILPSKNLSGVLP